MQIEQIEGSEERLAIASLCLDTDVLSKVAPNLPPNPFSSKVSNVVLGWCLSHYAQFQQAPGAATLTAIYSEWANTADDGTKSLVGKFLASLTPVQANADYILVLIERIVTKNSAKQLADKVTAALSNGDLQAATDVIRGWKPPLLTSMSDYVDPINDPSVVVDAYEKANYEPLIRFPEGSAIARWFGPTLHRDGFVVLCGADKAGKSSHLAALCQRALVQGKRVAYLNVGDMSGPQVIKRWSTAFVGKPTMAMKYRIPTAISYKDKEFSLEYQERVATSGYSKDDAIAAWAKLKDESGECRLRLVSKPNNSITVEEFHAMLLGWANTGWVPDVIGIDYAALFARSRGFDKTHEALDHIYKVLRGISSEFKCLLLTASQVNAESYSANTYWLGMSNFASSKSLWAHVTAALGINHTAQERQQQVTRFNWIVIREREYLSELPSQFLAVAGCPSIARFHTLSSFI